MRITVPTTTNDELVDFSINHKEKTVTIITPVKVKGRILKWTLPFEEFFAVADTCGWEPES